MPGTIRVGRPTRISHIPLSWDVTKARSNHEPKFRPVGDAVLRGRERSVGQVMEEMFASMPPIEPIIADYVSKLTGVGAILPDEALGEHLRSIAGLPQEEAEAVD